MTHGATTTQADQADEGEGERAGPPGPSSKSQNLAVPPGKAPT